MAFATSAHLALQYDVRRLCDLCQDAGAPVSTGSLSTNAVITWVLERATEMVLQAARVGEEYSEADLQALADSTTAGWSLRGLVCDIAYGLLVMRRGTGAADLDRLSPAYGQAMRTLKLIEDGELIFPRIDGEQNADAGTPRCADLTTQTTSPTVQQSWSATANSRLLPNSPLTNNPYLSGGNWPC